MTYLEGIDNSVFNTANPQVAGLDFVISRASWGTTLDRGYANHSAYTRSHGLVAGAYHFGTSGNVAGQVAAFLGNVGSTTKLVALDLEFNGSSDTMSNDEAAHFLQALAAKGFATRILYHSHSGYPHLGQTHNWIARWGPTPPTGTWSFWQYHGFPLDRNRFNGSVYQLRKLAGLAPTVQFHVLITGPTRLYSGVNGKVIGAVTKATYNCVRIKSSGLWWYVIQDPHRRGQAFKPNRYTIAREL